MSENDDDMERLIQAHHDGDITIEKVELYEDANGVLQTHIFFTPKEPIRFINLSFASVKSGIPFEEVIGNGFGTEYDWEEDK